MPQNLFSYQYQETSKSAYTSLGGLPLFMEMAKVSGLSESLHRSLKLNSQGWSDQEIIESIIQLNITGGECIEDIDRLEADKGLTHLTQNLAHKRRTGKEKKKPQNAFENQKTVLFLPLHP